MRIDKKDRVDELSERETEVLRLVATGASNKEIASQLHISANTVKVHLRNIFDKIDVSSRTEAAMVAVDAGLVMHRALPVEVPEINQPVDALVPASADRSTRKNALGAWRLYVGAVVLVIFLVSMGYRLWTSRSAGIGSPQTSDLSEIPTRWMPMAQLLEGRYGSATVSNENIIYIIAGRNQAGVTGGSLRYDPTTDSWSPIAEKPTPVYDANAGVIEGNIYVPGGCLADGKASDRLEIYNPLADSWSEGPRLPKAICGYGLVVLNGRAYLFGGWDGSEYLQDVFIYDSQSKTWSSGPSLPSRRAYMGAILSERKIYVVGGLNEEGALADSTIYLPDLALSGENPWRELPPMPEGRFSMGVTSIADIVYVIGGKTKNGDPTYPAIAFFNQSGEWKAIDEPPISLGAGLGVTNLGVYIYTTGGINGETPAADHYRYQAMYTFALPIIQK